MPSPTYGNSRPQCVYTSRSKDRRKSILRAFRLRLVLRLSSEQHAGLQVCRKIGSVLLQTPAWLVCSVKDAKSGNYAQIQHANEHMHTRIHACAHIHPPRSTPSSSTRLYRLLPYIGTRLRYVVNTINTDTIVPLVMCMQAVFRMSRSGHVSKSATGSRP